VGRPNRGWEGNIHIDLYQYSYEHVNWTLQAQRQDTVVDAVLKNITVFLDVKLCSLVKRYQRFEGTATSILKVQG
jgi:hypothetical protein